MNIKKLPKEIKKRYKNDAEGFPKIAYDLMEEMRLQSLKLADEDNTKQAIYENEIIESIVKSIKNREGMNDKTRS